MRVKNEEGKAPVKKKRPWSGSGFPRAKPSLCRDDVRHCELCGHRLSSYNANRVCFHHLDLTIEPYDKLWLEWSYDDLPLMNNGTPQCTGPENPGLWEVRMQETGIGDGIWRIT